MRSTPNPYEATRCEESAAPPPLVARRQLIPVAVGLLVTSILHIVVGLFYFTFVYSMTTAPDADPQAAHASFVLCLYYGISMLYCLLLITGAFSMLRRTSYLWAVTVCVLALVPFVGPCYVFGIPFGIWGLLLLRRPEVRDSFARA
jgi:hypothetical protein